MEAQRRSSIAGATEVADGLILLALLLMLGAALAFTQTQSRHDNRALEVMLLEGHPRG
jgi:hypothetical protein